MVTQRTTLSNQSPQSDPIQPRRPSGTSSLALDQGGNNSWDQAASSPRLQIRQDGIADNHDDGTGSSGSLPLLQMETRPAEPWRPRAEVPTAAHATHREEDNVWEESMHPPSYYELSRPAASGRTSETNPFLRKPAPPTGSSTALPGQASPQQQQHSQSQSQLKDSFSRLMFDEPPTSHNPWQAAIDAEPARVASSHPQSAAPSDMGTDPWARSSPDPASREQQASSSPALVSLQSDGSGWEDTSSDEDESEEEKPPQCSPDKAEYVPPPPTGDELARQQRAWDDASGLVDEKKAQPEIPSQTPPETTTAPSPGSGSGTASATGSTPIDDWNIVDPEAFTPSPKDASPSRGSESRARETGEAVQIPPLPPRQPGDRARWTSSRLPPDGSSETYHIKKVRWNDPSSESNPRLSPILIQNENGPCPLVALVNTLTLTTPADVSDTSLVNVLSSREQVSLNLLLDAVFEELMSPRRTRTDDSLPDVTDLYAFLQSLHTGMNVNPRFIPTPEMMDAFRRTSLTDVELPQRGRFIPGTFENTLEMSLYAAFSIPLIHGWLPALDDPVLGAMHRHAASYEDTQNLLFREEELEQKLSSDTGLTEGEQSLYHDIVTIKYFLDSSATQLTPWGIEVIGKVMRPGTFAILFRNDHFSTMYCHPKTQQLFTLVTDAGYESHSDVVWESLLDVNGELNEYLTGDFRPLGTVAATSSEAGHGLSRGEAAPNRDRHGQPQDEHAGQSFHYPEQEDHDLALALQLQEEEDHKHRRREERRKREAVLSQRYIEQQTNRRPGAPGDARTANHLVPPRRSSNSINVGPPVATTTTTATNVPSSRRRDARNHPPPTHFEQMQRINPGQQAAPAQLVRPLVPPLRRPGVNRPVNADEEPPPPSYEQAAQVPAYNPPPGHPTHPRSAASNNPSRRVAAMNVGPYATVGAPGAGFSDGGQRYSNSAGRSRMPMSAGMANMPRERDCIVM